MTAQVIATSGGARIYETGARIQVAPGVAYRIHDMDDAGASGPCLEPPALQLAANEPEAGDLTVTLPDGTALIFEGMVEQFEAGSGLLGESGALVVASLEQVAAPAAGSGEGGEMREGSAAAHNPADPHLANIFGEAPEGPVIQLPWPPFELDEEEVAVPDLGEEPTVEELPPPPPPPTIDPDDDCVITADDGDLVIDGEALLSNDTGNGLQIISVQDYSGPGVINLNPDGNVEISAVAANPALDNSALTQTFTYTVQDLDGLTETAQVKIYVDEVRHLDGNVLNPALDLGNDEGEIFIPTQSPNAPLVGHSIIGGQGDDFMQIRDEQRVKPNGGDGFDTLLADTEVVNNYMEFLLPDDFSQANHLIERIDGSDDASVMGVVRLTPFENLVEVNWDFSDVELIAVDEIVGRGGDDIIIGSAGDDAIFGDASGPGTGTGGNDGDDTINGGAGNDSIDVGAGPGNLVIVSSVDNGLDEIYSFDNVGVGDMLSLSDLFDELELDLGPLGAADRFARIELVHTGGFDTEVWIDTDAGDPAGDGAVNSDGRALAGAGDVQVALIMANPDLGASDVFWDNGTDLIVA